MWLLQVDFASKSVYDGVSVQVGGQDRTLCGVDVVVHFVVHFVGVEVH